MIALRMARVRALVVALAMLVVGVAVAACGDSNESPSSDRADTPRIYMLWPSFESEGYIQQKTGAEAAIAELGDKVEVKLDSGTSRASANDQIRKIDSAITQQYDVIALNTGAVGAELVPAVERAQAQGIKVMTFDQSVPGADVETYIQFDGEQDGRLMGEYMTSVLPDGGEVGIVNCFAENPLIKAINSGIEQGLAGSDVRIVARLDALCDPSRARTAAENMITAHPSLKGIFALWDVQAMGTIPAVEKKGEPFFLVGGGGERDALELIARGGALDASTDAHFPEFGRMAVETAYALAQGRTVEPEIKMPFDIVTRDNAADVLAGVDSALAGGS